MSSNFDSPSSIQPLNLGNVVSAGLRLYRSHVKLYLTLAFTAYAWVFVPIYGWAKCVSTLAIISRLAFRELVNQPESVETSRRFVNQRLWQFLIMGLVMFAIGVGLLIPLAIFLGIFTAFVVTSSIGGNTPNPGVILVIALLAIILIPVFFLVVLWIQARFSVVELPLVIEDNVDGLSTISRSWELTKGHVWRIVGILFVSGLITIPIQLPFTITNSVIQGNLQPLVKNNPSYALLSFFISLIINLLSATLVVPFWQSIKAVIYYDLRSRREGLGLQLRDREI